MVMNIGLIILRVLKVAAPILLSSALSSKGKELINSAVDLLLNEPLAKSRTPKGY